MNKLISLLLLLSVNALASDNEIFVDQVGATANIDLEQLGSGNIIGGLTAVAGTMTALDLDGSSMTLDINQIGNNNKYLGDMYADSYTGYFNFDGDTNTFTSKMDPTNAYGADNSNVNVNVNANANVNAKSATRQGRMSLQLTQALCSRIQRMWVVTS